tara:strand:- start:881 stop:1708 length:828 start_codon:yes stop_codon:yes gene_type:complete
MTFKNESVLNFYKELPFNIYGNKESAIEQIKKYNPLEIYPELKKIFKQYGKIKIIDFGCGGGWLVNSLSYHLKDKVDVTGVDFNPTVIEYANEIRSNLNLKSNFTCSDLFAFKSDFKFDLVISLGVLHHTNNCSEAIKYIAKFVNNNSYLFLGLYHSYGRRPFLEYFNNMKNKDENFKFNEYKKLHKIVDEKKMYSWFRDQVLHPHETQHTFEEMIPIFESIDFKIIATSINKFERIDNFDKIIYQEKKLENYSKEKIINKEYYPGFFITIGRKN